MQRHPSLIFGCGDVISVVIMQVEVDEEARFKLDFCIETGSQVPPSTGKPTNAPKCAEDLCHNKICYDV